MNANTPARESLVGHTARPIVMSVTDRNRKVIHTETVPAGTLVYVTHRADGTARVRVCGSLLSQTVYPAAVTCA